MKNILTALILLLAALFTGCTTADKLNNVRIGMSKDQVIAVMGQPDSTSAQANIEYLTYYLSNDSSYTYGRDQPYMVRLVDGKVESF
ncbi:MAG TPA: outer membrane protein assembly factor BamE, partial [Opitutaceae bacterium]|nr:outer membrane protein assembly factor BamE [Opitutaceae bacterium]